MPLVRVRVVVEGESEHAAASQSGARVGVGMGMVSGTLSGECPDPDAYPSFFGAGETRHHRVFSGTKLFACPLYLTAARRIDEHVMDVLLPTQRPPQLWVLRGVAMFCTDLETV
jgi:hypothetical protein